MSYASIPSLSLRFQISDFRGRFTRTHHGPVTAENDSPLWFLHFRPPYHPSFLTGLIPHAILVGLVATVLLLYTVDVVGTSTPSVFVRQIPR